MRPLLRYVVTAPIRSKLRHELPKTREMSTLILPPRSIHVTERAVRGSIPLSRMCHGHRQVRWYSNNILAHVNDSFIPMTPKEANKAKTKVSDPLRILFCGSDEFSCASLEALHEEHLRNPALIQSIDVVVRPGKPTGRGNKIIQHPPIRDLATKLGLLIHERDTFTGWDMPPGINLIIAVSFGLFVPRRLLKAAKYGGLNVHPSYLPILRGSAPLQRAILAGHQEFGISLQTLDDRAFDHGLVLARTRRLEISENDRYADLLARVTPLAAEFLVSQLRAGVHVPPLRAAAPLKEVGENPPLAPKITSRDSQLRANAASQIWRQYRALGSVWFYSRDRKGVRKRVIIEQIAHTYAVRKGQEFRNIRLTVALPTNADSSSAPSLNDDQKAGLARDAALYAKDAGISSSKPYLAPSEKDDAESSKGSIPYLIPLEEDEVGNSESGKDTKKTYLVLWFPEGKKQDVCYLGPYPIETIKVEGEQAKKPPQALKNFRLLVELADEKPQE
ncbi:Formyltransferase [Daldinia sp. FL1419]|nr:Formyltransferase [Daldinia sp. FL1419]